MKKIFAIIGTVCLMSSCATLSELGLNFGGNESDSGSGVASANVSQPSFTMKEQGDKGHWVSLPANGSITVIGVSNPMSKQADEITSAKEDAARKIAMYYGINGAVETVSGFDGRKYFGSVSEYTIALSYDQDYSKYIEQLTFDQKKDVLKVDRAIYVRFQYPVPAESINYMVAKTSNDRPQWTKDILPPQINGFMTAVGIAQNQSRLKDTINKSIESAVAIMVQEISTSVSSTDSTLISSSGLSGGSSSLIATSSKGKLKSFHVIEFWIDPQTKYVYTLAIAKKGE